MNNTLVPGVLRLESNTRYIPGFFMETLHDLPTERSGNEVNITFNVKQTRFGETQYQQVLSHTYGDAGAKQVLFLMPTGLPGISLRLLLENLDTKPRITANKIYCALVRLAMGRVLPVGVHLRDIFAVSLLLRGCCLVHAAGISKSSKAVVLVGAANTGKTTTALLACRQDQGFDFLGEDMVVTDGSTVYAFPLTPGIGHGTDTTGYRLKKKSEYLKIRIADFADNKFPSIKYLPLRIPELNVLSLVPQPNIAHNAQARYIIFLERATSRQFMPLPKDEAFRKILLLNELEMAYSSNRVLQAYSYFNPEIDIQQLVDVESQTLKRLVQQADCFLCRAENPRAYWDMIRTNIGNIT